MKKDRSMKRVQRICPSCGGKGIAFYSNKMASIGEIDLSYDLMECQNCHAVFSSNMASSAEYDRYYTCFSKHDWAQLDENSDSATCHRAIADMMRKTISADSTIVDIGCGTGYLLHCLQQTGFNNILGLDPSPHTPKSVKEYYGIEGIHTGFVNDAHEILPLDDIDVCCFTGVLEHLYDPQNQLKRIVDNLRKGSFLVVSVPDVDNFTSNGREPYGEFSLEHINYFTRLSLNNFFASIKCRMIACSSVHGTHETNLISIAVKDENAKTKDSDDVKKIKNYLEESKLIWDQAIESLCRKLTKETVIYGAGSHTARLLPQLEQRGKKGVLSALIDQNPNLQGQQFGGLEVIGPDKLHSYSDCDFLISSYKFEKEMFSFLKNQGIRNPIIIYGDLGL